MSFFFARWQSFIGCRDKNISNGPIDTQVKLALTILFLTMGLKRYFARICTDIDVFEINMFWTYYVPRKHKDKIKFQRFSTLRKSPPASSSPSFLHGACCLFIITPVIFCDIKSELFEPFCLNHRAITTIMPYSTTKIDLQAAAQVTSGGFFEHYSCCPHLSKHEKSNSNHN